MVQNSAKVTKKVLVFRKVARSCSLTKKLLKILKVTKKLLSRIWKDLVVVVVLMAENDRNVVLVLKGKQWKCGGSIWARCGVDVGLMWGQCGRGTIKIKNKMKRGK